LAALHLQNIQTHFPQLISLRRIEAMTRTQRILAVALSGALLLGGFAIGRVTDTPKTSAEENHLVSDRTTSATPNLAAGEQPTFYLSDYKAGYADGYNATLGDSAANVVNTPRVGYNEGYKQGFADAYRTRAGQQMSSAFAPGPASIAPVRMSYRSVPVVYRGRERRRSSKLKTALTIAAPAAIGAGIGLAAGGKKGAGVGALVGGGGGALYHLFKNR
jgi:hypothetical protein